MTQILLRDETADLLNDDECRALCSAFVMGYERASGLEHGVIDLSLVRSMPMVESLGLEPNGYMNPETGAAIINVGRALRSAPPAPDRGLTTRVMRLVLTAAHEGTHVGQMARGEMLPDDETAAAEYHEDPPYEREARETSVDVLKGAFPSFSGAIPLGTSGRMYRLPDVSTFAADWRAVESGATRWTLALVPTATPRRA